MGCWNGTCGISHLPIFHGEPIRLVLIVGHTRLLADENLVRTPGTWEPDVREEYVDKDGNKHEFYAEGRQAIPEVHEKKRRNSTWRSAWYSGLCGAEDVFFPRCIPLRGKYDDYGGIEDIENSLNFTAIIHQFQRDLDEYPAGRFDIPVEIKRGMPLEGDNGLLRAIERGGVTVNRWKDDRPHAREHHLPVATWMVREDIFQAMINAKLEGRWSDPDDKRFNIEQYYKDAEEYRSELRAEADKDALMNEVMKTGGGTAADRYAFIRSYTNRNSENALRRSLYSPPFENGLDFYDEWLIDCVHNKLIDPDDDKVKSLLREIAEFAFFCFVKDAMRVAWMPQCGKGSQDDRMSVHAAVAEQVLKTVDEKRKQWAAERAQDENEE